ncbi:DUF2612 domain-containing protein, partial [Paraburkholderia sp. BR10936]|uniref:DUF2612 domain-containing protein n=1 Tax=Paraburkholderia sp. BR10936 TaxID=3236993 RepID=UPI0034D191FE
MAYSDLLVWQYKGKPRAKATAELFDTLVKPTWAGFMALMDTYDIDHVTGISLDVIGRIVGVSRILQGAAPRTFFGFNGEPDQTSFPNPYAGPFTRGQRLGGKWYRYGGAIADSATANDEEMRTLIRMKVVKNYQDASLPNLITGAMILTGGAYANAVDNLDMTVTLFIIRSRVTPFVEFVLNYMDLLPRASGVEILINTDYDFDPQLFVTI